MNKENVELKNNNLGITEDDFGCMLYKLVLLNESFSYYKTMIKHDWDRELFYSPTKPNGLVFYTKRCYEIGDKGGRYMAIGFVLIFAFGGTDIIL